MRRRRQRAETDEDLLLERRPSRAGAAFGEFYSRHERRVLSYFVRRVGAPEVAADLSAETFARALEARRRFDPARGVAVGWLFGIAANVLSESARAGRVEQQARERLGLEPVVVDDQTVVALSALADGQALLEGLSREQAHAIGARVFEDRDYADIAASLNCSEAVVRQRVSRGLTRLRTMLESNGGRP